MFESDSSEPHGRRSRISARLFPRRRRGLSTAWLLIFGPVFLIMLYFAVELGNLHVALTELENGLEAAALAGVREFAQTGDHESARDYTLAYAAANVVAGDPLVLARNENTGNVNGNDDCDDQIADGVDVILGAIEGTNCNDYEFCANKTPGGVSGVYVSLTIRVETQQDTFNDTAPSSTWYDFRIQNFTATDGVNPYNNIEIAAVSFDVTTLGGFFDLRDKTGGGGGLGADQNNGLAPIFTTTGVTPHAFSPAFVSGNTTTTSTDFIVSFPATGVGGAFQPNATDEFRFGVDTDGIPPSRGPGTPGEAIDYGSDLIGTRVTVTFRDTLTSTTSSLTGFLGPLTPVPNVHTSILTFTNEELLGGIFGVRTQKRVEVTPLCNSLLGVPMSPFYISAQVTALCEAGGDPHLVRIANFNCNCP